MAAFDRIKSGVDGLDAALDNIRLGDNVVWQVQDLDEFRFFAEPYVRQAVADNRSVTYIRFAKHEPVIQDLSGVDVVRFDPDEGFEAFAVAIHEEITKKGFDAFYVFDCLSELQSVWYTDLMMGNFFRVTCPYLFILDTVAYFPLLRGRHSLETVARIQETTQLLLDVFSSPHHKYVHPIKVWNRYSNRMFMPQSINIDTGKFYTVEDGVAMSRYYNARQSAQADDADQNFDSYDRFFSMAKLSYQAGMFTPQMEEQIIDSTMTKDEHLKKLVKKYFKPKDYFALRDRMVGSGAIGGKACGMLLARKICETDVPEFARFSEPHDSFYIGSDVFYTYIVSNDAWNLRVRQRSDEGYFEAAKGLQEKLLSGTFPPKVRDRFRQVLEYYGQSPYIVRSSSFLEDGFGNAFAGKYESVFCCNQGTIEERMEEMENAVRHVYGSTMDYSALEYRRLRGLDKRDEQMAVLVQRVSGSYFGDFFMPAAAGVGYSHSAYKLSPDMDVDAGMLRLVAGLGTKAVDRTEVDYPRLVNLDRPAVHIEASLEKRHKHSQRNVDVLDIKKGIYREAKLDEILEATPFWYKNMIMEHDFDAESRLRERGRDKSVWFVSCQRLLENPDFPPLMKKILMTLQSVYENPVDIEYAINIDENGEFVVNLLQCRPLYTFNLSSRVDVGRVELKDVLFELKGASMGESGHIEIDIVIDIDPVKYYEYPYNQKATVASVVGRINRHFSGTGQKLMLLTPGRVGTSSPELGVPVTFGEISNLNVLCEISDSRAGYNPELSYGSHMFQDLVEADIRYNAILQNETTLAWNEAVLSSRGCCDIFEEIIPDMDKLDGMIKVYETPGLSFWLDSMTGHVKCGF